MCDFRFIIYAFAQKSFKVNLIVIILWRLPFLSHVTTHVSNQSEPCILSHDPQLQINSPRLAVNFGVDGPKKSRP